MTPKLFVETFIEDAKQSQVDTGISYIATLAQAAVESAWGEVAPGNMFFGVKDFDGVNGNEQLVTTTEYSSRNNLKFPVILSIIPVIKGGKKMFKYRVKDYFRKYNTPAESFTDHGNFFIRNKRYAAAMEVKGDPLAFIDAIAKAGYATDPQYPTTLKTVIGMIEKYI